MKKSRLSPRLFFTLFLAAFCAAALSLSAHDLYWTEQKRIVASDIDGGNVTVIFDGETSSPQMASYAVDIAVTSTHIYWSGHDGKDIWRANRDGSDAVQLVTDAGESIHFLALNEAGGKIYFTDWSGGIYQADLSDGDNIVNVHPGGAGSFTGVVLDTTAFGSDDELLSISAATTWLSRTIVFSGGPVSWEEVELEGGATTYGLAFDPDTRTVYYTNSSEGTLRAFNYNTWTHQLIKNGLQEPLGVKLSPSGTHLLIAERNKGISAFQIDNFGYELLVPSTDVHFGVAVAADPANLPPGQEPANVLFVATFDADPIGGAPSAGWTVSGPGQGTATVLEDTGNSVFGMGSENRFLRVESAASFGLTGTLSSSTEILTLSFDYIGRVNFGDGSRWLNVDMRVGGTRVHVTSIRNLAANIRAPGNPSIGGNDLPVRVDTVMNNSLAPITYDTPNGGTADLASGMASVWLYHYITEEWEHLIEEYIFTSESTPGTPMDNIRFDLDSNAIRSFDLDNVYVVDGAAVGEFPRESSFQVLQPPPLPVVWSLAHGERTYLSGAQRYRGMAIHPSEGYLAVVQRDAPTVGLVDGMTGAHLGTLSVSGVSGGNFTLNEIAIDEAGVIYAGNLRTDTANGTYRLYRWADKDAVPQLVFNAALNSADPTVANRRFGDSLVVLGSGANTEIFLGSWAGTVIARLTPIPADPNNQFQAEIFTAINLPGNSLRDLSPGPDGLLYGPTAAGLHKIELDRNALTATGVGGHLLAGAIEPIGYSAADGYLGGIDTNTTEFFLYDAETLTPVAMNAFATNNTYPNAHGQVLFGNGMVYALATDNGILAMSLGGGSPLSFATWVAGFGLPTGQDGPGDNPSGDGVENVLKYALGLDPTEASRDGLPEGGIADIGGQDYLTLTFIRPTGLDDIMYHVAAADEVTGWSGSGILVSTAPAGSGFEEVVYRHPDPLSANSRGFLRLEVSFVE